MPFIFQATPCCRPPRSQIKATLLILFIAISNYGCTTTRLVMKDQTLSIKTPSILIERNQQTHHVKNLEVSTQNVRAERVSDKTYLSLNRGDVKEIRETSHYRGMYRGATSGVGVGLGFGLLLGVISPSTMLEMAATTSVSLGLLGGLAGFVAGHTNRYRFVDIPLISNQNPPLLSPSSYRIRNRYYIGMDLRNVRGNTPLSGRILSFEQLSAVTGYSAGFEAGITANPYTLIGFRFSPIEFNTDTLLTETMETYGDVLFLTTFFPHKSGHFVRAGFGHTSYYFQRSDVIESPVSPEEPDKDQRIFADTPTENKNINGLTTMLGLGYAFWLGEHYNLTMSADLNSYFFERQRASHTLSVNIGMYWF